MVHHSTGLVRRFEDRHSIAHQSQIVRRGNACWTSPDDCDFLTASDIRAFVGAPEDGLASCCPRRECLHATHPACPAPLIRRHTFQ